MMLLMQVYDTLEKGFCPEPSAGTLIPLPERAERLRAILRQESPSKFYFVITGSNGRPSQPGLV